MLIGGIVDCVSHDRKFAKEDESLILRLRTIPSICPCALKTKAVNTLISSQRLESNNKSHLINGYDEWLSICECQPIEAINGNEPGK